MSLDLIVHPYIDDGTFYKTGNQLIIGDSSYYPLIFATDDTLQTKTNICINYAKEKIRKSLEQKVNKILQK